jgi:hypothetical protein
VGALSDLYGSMLGKPIIKVASAFWAAKETASSFMGKKSADKASKASKADKAEAKAASDTAAPAAKTSASKE